MHPLLQQRRGLYAITDGPRADLVAACAAAMRGGAALVQYRDKSADGARRLSEASALAALCRAHGVPFIVNDDVDLAARCAAHGVHLGQGDGDVASARRRLGRASIIGVSCYDSIARARELAEAGADYLAFGAFHPSSTKPHNRRVGVGVLREARMLRLPLVAIGGITPDNAQPLIAAGADFVAAITGVFGAGDIHAAAQRYTRLFQAEAHDHDPQP